ncbi:MaoC/PaaZ C-terminal domain-containing protein [Aliidiomarina celeris]|uniref:MaoC/PaaZ C-terminal domain-containing protein n=1 Tax=Aliidiomarina celeris TaxID=2249428 RepID=UPI000DEA1B1B|nr:MaoC/PaaZ C-terminal domain-containing protein [Aliidiomarina celeris]
MSEQAQVKPNSQKGNSFKAGATPLPQLPLMLLKAVPTMVRRGKVAEELNALTAQYSCSAISKSHLDAYHRQFPGMQSKVPLTYFYLLAQRAHLALMLDDRFPWPLLGMVHVANRMECFAEPDLTQPFILDVQIEFPPRAATRKRVRPMYWVNFYQGDTRVVQCSSAYQVGGGKKSPSRKSSRSTDLSTDGYERVSDWLLESDLGRHYAKLSGDYNPIHLHPWLSRWFGFNRPIIHGMYSVARAQASIEENYGKPVKMLDIGFRKPVVLPTSVLCLVNAAESTLMVTDMKRSRSYLDGSFSLFS